jgi:hypothetical protein
MGNGCAGTQGRRNHDHFGYLLIRSAVFASCLIMDFQAVHALGSQGYPEGDQPKRGLRDLTRRRGDAVDTTGQRSRNQSENKDRRSTNHRGHRGHRERQCDFPLCPLCPLWFSDSHAFFFFFGVAISLGGTEKLNLSGTKMDSLGGGAAFTRLVIACCYDFMDILRASAPPREPIAAFRINSLVLTGRAPAPKAFASKARKPAMAGARSHSERWLSRRRSYMAISPARHHAAVHRQHGARDPSSGWGGEKQDRSDDIFRLSDATEGMEGIEGG